MTGSGSSTSIEQDAEGSHHLFDEIVASPWSDGRVHDEAVVETAAADAAPAGADLSGLVDLDFADDAAESRPRPLARRCALRPGRDRGRRSRALAGWAEAVDGRDDALEAIAGEDVVGRLLYPDWPQTTNRVVVRAPRAEGLRIVELDSDVKPPTVTVEAELRGARYVENRDTTTVVSGSREGESSWTERWTLALSDDPKQPWRLAATSQAAATG